MIPWCCGIRVGGIHRLNPGLGKFKTSYMGPSEVPVEWIPLASKDSHCRSGNSAAGRLMKVMMSLTPSFSSALRMAVLDENPMMLSITCSKLLVAIWITSDVVAADVLMSG